jgi:hypothetical protein
MCGLMKVTQESQLAPFEERQVLYWAKHLVFHPYTHSFPSSSILTSGISTRTSPRYIPPSPLALMCSLPAPIDTLVMSIPSTGASLGANLKRMKNVPRTSEMERNPRSRDTLSRTTERTAANSVVRRLVSSLTLNRSKNSTCTSVERGE